MKDIKRLYRKNDRWRIEIDCIVGTIDEGYKEIV